MRLTLQSDEHDDAGLALLGGEGRLPGIQHVAELREDDLQRETETKASTSRVAGRRPRCRRRRLPPRRIGSERRPKRQDAHDQVADDESGAPTR